MDLHYVYETNVDTNDPILRKILEFCSTRDINVKLRKFSPFDYEEDREYVTHLPAVHLYTNRDYQETIYPDFKPIQILQLEYDKYQMELAEKEAKKQIWEAKIKHLKNLFRSLKTDSKPSISEK